MLLTICDTYLTLSIEGLLMKKRKESDSYRIVDPVQLCNLIQPALISKICSICRESEPQTKQGNLVNLGKVNVSLCQGEQHEIVCIWSAKSPTFTAKKKAKILKLENGISIVWDGDASTINDLKAYFDSST